MVHSAGIDAATQRVREIRDRLAALEGGTQKPDVSARMDAFGRILDDQLNAGQTPPLPPVSLLEDMVENQAQSIGLDPNLAKAVVKAESGFNPNAVSSAGAKGLMQLMPSTAQSLGVQAILDPQENVEGGTQYLKSLLTKYHSVPKALAAYNAGPGTVDKYGGIPPYTETQNYVNRVLQYQRQYEQQTME